MNEFKHTPAPWKAENGIARIYIEDSNGEEIAQITQRGFYNTEANAKHMPAPDLLEALIDVEKYLVERNIETRGTIGRTIILPKIRAAIAKAKN